MSWFITGTGTHYLDAVIEFNKNKSKYAAIDSNHEAIPLFAFSTIGPFWTLPEAKKWLYNQRLDWIIRQTHGIHPNEVDLLTHRKILGFNALENALFKLQEKNPELKI